MARALAAETAPLAPQLVDLTGLAAGAQASTLDKVKDSSSARIGYANETPFAYTALDGSVTGESPEIVKKIFVGFVELLKHWFDFDSNFLEFFEFIEFVEFVELSIHLARLDVGVRVAGVLGG